MTDFFIEKPISSSALLLGEYQPALVVLSVLIAIMICCVAMQMARISQASDTLMLKRLAIATGALAMGIGIWSMHFIGMLAFQIHTPVYYDIPITIASIVPAIIASVLAISLLSRKHVSRGQLFLSAIYVGTGIGAMHYTGMEAMKMEPILRYDLSWFIASVVVAVIFSWIALYLRFGLKSIKGLSSIKITLLSGSVMGSCIATVHYVAMRAACFIGEAQPNFVFETNLSLIAGISSATLFIGALVLAGNLYLFFRKLYDQLRRSEAIQKAIVDTSLDGILTCDQRGTILSANPAMSRLFGWREMDLIKRNINLLMPQNKRITDQNMMVDMLRNHARRFAEKGHESVGLRKNKSIFPLRLSIGEINVNNQLLFVGFIADITEQKRTEKFLEREATHDSLTDLPNRRLLALALPRSLARVERSGEIVALLFIDLDGFKQVNDNLGHDVGDSLLITVAQRLLHLVRTSDIVARLGGDEFVIVLDGLLNKEDPLKLAHRILEELCKPVNISGNTITISASIGLSFYEQGCRLSADEFLQTADQAMYNAKHNGKNTIVVLDSKPKTP